MALFPNIFRMADFCLPTETRIALTPKGWNYYSKMNSMNPGAPKGEIISKISQWIPTRRNGIISQNIPYDWFLFANGNAAKITITPKGWHYYSTMNSMSPGTPKGWHYSPVHSDWWNLIITHNFEGIIKSGIPFRRECDFAESPDYLCITSFPIVRPK